MKAFYCRVYFPNYYYLEQRNEDILMLPLWEKLENIFFVFFTLLLSPGAIRSVTLKTINTRINNQLLGRQTFGLDIGWTHSQPPSCRARLVDADDGLGYIVVWIHSLGDESLHAAMGPKYSTCR